MEKTIVLKLPSQQTPGFLRFLRGLAVFSEVMGKPLGRSPSEIDAAIEWLVSMAEGDKDGARDTLMGMSGDELAALLQNVNKEVNVAPDPLPSPASAAG